MGKGGILGQLLTMAIVHEVRDHAAAPAQQPEAAPERDDETEPMTKKEAKQVTSDGCLWMFVFLGVGYFGEILTGNGDTISVVGYICLLAS
jgi:hypothetical protein